MVLIGADFTELPSVFSPKRTDIGLSSMIVFYGAFFMTLTDIL